MNNKSRHQPLPRAWASVPWLPACWHAPGKHGVRYASQRCGDDGTRTGPAGYVIGCGLLKRIRNHGNDVATIRFEITHIKSGACWLRKRDPVQRSISAVPHVMGTPSRRIRGAVNVSGAHGRTRTRPVSGFMRMGSAL